MIKTEGLGENKIAYMKHIKTQSFHMGVIFMLMHLIWKRQKYLRIHIHITRYHIGNVYCDVVPNLQA